METVNNEFNIMKKTCFTVMDSGANFLKPFKHFALDEAEDLLILPVPTDSCQYVSSRLVSSE